MILCIGCCESRESCQIPLVPYLQCFSGHLAMLAARLGPRWLRVLLPLSNLSSLQDVCPGVRQNQPCVVAQCRVIGMGRAIVLRSPLRRYSLPAGNPERAWGTSPVCTVFVHLTCRGGFELSGNSCRVTFSSVECGARRIEGSLPTIQSRPPGGSPP
jgi:hypothetical protein